MGIIACGTKPFPAIPEPSIACYKTCEPSLGPCCVTKLEAAINRKTGSRACLGFFQFCSFCKQITSDGNFFLDKRPRAL